MKLLETKATIITGAGSGIGKAAALLFAEHGAKVVVSDINEGNGQATVNEIKANGGVANFFKADSENPADNEALVAHAVKEFGQLDIAVNNAGIGGPLGATGEYPLDGWKKPLTSTSQAYFMVFGTRFPL